MISASEPPSPATPHGRQPVFQPVSAQEASEITVIPVLAERLVVGKRRVERSVTRVETVTHEREQFVDEELAHERVEVERVPVGRFVDAVPPVREEGDTTILPVVEEVVVVERRLMLKEEVRIRRVRVTEHHHEVVTLREQEAVITCTETEQQAAPSPDLTTRHPEPTKED